MFASRGNLEMGSGWKMGDQMCMEWRQSINETKAKRRHAGHVTTVVSATEDLWSTMQAGAARQTFAIGRKPIGGGSTHTTETSFNGR
jgi:hypothetical protein